MKKHYLLTAAMLFLGLTSNAVGIDVEKSAALFDLDFTEAYEVASVSGVHPTLAQCGQHIVVNLGNGSAPIYVNPATGQKEGEIAIDGALATGSVASDAKGNMLICNYCEAHKDITFYKASSATATPEVFFTCTNDNSLAIGRRIHVQGDLDGTAVILATCDGVWGVTGSKSFVRWDVVDGKAGEPAVCEFTDATMEYWISGANEAKVVAKSTDVADGYFVGYYKADKFYHVTGDCTTADYSMAGPGGNNAANSCDTRNFNGSSYTALMEQTHFPQWGITGAVYLYDTTSLDGFSGSVSTAECLKSTTEMANYSELGTKSGDLSGDVLIASTDNTMGVYYISTTYLNFGGVMFQASTGVEGINADNNAPVQYFNLQGVEVENPANGLYIRRQGAKASKVLVK